MKLEDNDKIKESIKIMKVITDLLYSFILDVKDMM